MEPRRKNWQRTLVTLAALLLTLAASRVAAADTITVMWDGSSDASVAGYIVYIGTQPGAYTQNVNVGLSTSYSFTTAVPGQLYCFAVSAYAAGPLEGPKSAEVCGYSDQRPTLTNPGTQSSTAGQSDTLQLVGSDPDGLAVTYSATGLPPGLTVGASTGFISGTPTTAGNYSVTATVSDGVLTASQTFSWNVSGGDTTAPVVGITAPTSGTTFTTSTTPLTVSGTASDAVGVTQVTWANSRGGTGTATGTTSWSASGITLLGGSNVITITARDAAGNTATDTLTVTYNAPDTTAPVVGITAPTSGTTFTTSITPLTVSGTASDAVGVTQITWANSTGGTGTATGTTSWSASGITLLGGSNVITITARDAAGNTATDTLTVTYNAPDTTAPVATITLPTAASTHTTSTSTLNVSGTSSDAVGVTQVTWANDRGGSGTATGTTTWSVSGITLLSGQNVITVTARDAAGNSGSDSLTVTYDAPDVTNPVVTITGPTSAATHSVTATPMTVSGTASDNVGVTQVTWANDRGGSGTASGTTTWTASGVALQSGANVITITARDAAGHTSTDTLTVTYAPPDTTNPVVAIEAPTAAATFTSTTATMSLGGTASDNVGVTQVTWANNRGGNGTATGTTAWNVSSIALQDGSNTLTVTARDAAGNTATDVLTVTYSAPDTTAPTASITQPTSAATFATNTATVDVSGTASDAVGVTQVTWTNDRGGSGTATGTTSWSVNGVTLQSGANVITITARDAAGNSVTDVLTVTYNALDTIPPDVAIAQPTSASTFTTTTGTVNVSGTSSDAGGVTQVTWANDRGGSGIATGTTSWSANGLGLQIGSNVITIRARDAAGNAATRTLTVALLAPLALTNLTANLTAPQRVGTPITFTATATNGTAPYSYKWWLFDGTSWTLLQNWSASNTYTWTPSVANSAFRIGVWVRNAGSTADSYDNPQANGSVAFAIDAASQGPLTLTAITPSVPAPQAVGTTITFTATVTGGIGPHEFMWFVYENNRWRVMQTWSRSNTWTWTPTSPGSRTRVAVWVRNAGSTSNVYDNPAANGSIPFPIYRKWR